MGILLSIVFNAFALWVTTFVPGIIFRGNLVTLLVGGAILGLFNLIVHAVIHRRVARAMLRALRPDGPRLLRKPRPISDPSTSRALRIPSRPSILPRPSVSAASARSLCGLCVERQR